jgi:hypothetical protein
MLEEGTDDANVINNEDEKNTTTETLDNRVEDDFQFMLSPSYSHYLDEELKKDLVIEDGVETSGDANRGVDEESKNPLVNSVVSFPKIESNESIFDPHLIDDFSEDSSQKPILPSERKIDNEPPSTFQLLAAMRFEDISEEDREKLDSWNASPKRNSVVARRFNNPISSEIFASLDGINKVHGDVRQF